MRPSVSRSVSSNIFSSHHSTCSDYLQTPAPPTTYIGPIHNGSKPEPVYFFPLTTDPTSPYCFMPKTRPSWHTLPSRCPHNPYLVLLQAQREQSTVRGFCGVDSFDLLIRISFNACVCICRRRKKQVRDHKTHKQNLSFISSSGNNTQRRLCTKYGLL